MTAGVDRAPGKRPVVTVVARSDRDLPRAVAELTRTCELRVVTGEDLESALPGSEVLYLWAPYSRDLERCWHLADRLDWVHVGMAGIDDMMFPALAASAVTVTSSSGVLSTPIAEFVLGAVLLWAKGLDVSVRDTMRGRQHYRENRALSDLSALVIGLGSIGGESARLLRAAGVGRVDGAARRSGDGDEILGRIHALSDLPAVAGAYDVVVTTLPLNSGTAGLIDARVLAVMPEQSLLVNVGRGAVVDTTALAERMTDGRLSAVLDVVDPEPLPPGHRLWEAPGLTISPHMSGDHACRHEAYAALFVRNVQRWRMGETLLNRVDPVSGAAREPRLSAAEGAALS